MAIGFSGKGLQKRERENKREREREIKRVRLLTVTVLQYYTLMLSSRRGHSIDVWIISTDDSVLRIFPTDAFLRS